MHPLTIAIGYPLTEGASGGGQRWARNLSRAAAERGHRVISELSEPGIDVILLTDPRGWSPDISFGPREVLNYLDNARKRPLIIHRINECDERKGTRRMNPLLRATNSVADVTIFIGSWLKDLNLWLRDTPHDVILNGADASIFHAEDAAKWGEGQALRFVTHHWGAHAMKGWDMYKELDRLAGNELRGQVALTYIGNVPAPFSLPHSTIVEPLNGEALAEALRQAHVYITGSINEPAGMHHIEGALCGLPLIYRNSGALPEYCRDFGLIIEEPCQLAQTIKSMRERYASFKQRMPAYPHTAERMCTRYLDAIEHYHAERETLWRKRLSMRTRAYRVLCRRLPQSKPSPAHP